MSDFVRWVSFFGRHLIRHRNVFPSRVRLGVVVLTRTRKATSRTPAIQSWELESAQSAGRSPSNSFKNPPPGQDGACPLRRKMPNANEPLRTQTHTAPARVRTCSQETTCGLSRQDAGPSPRGLVSTARVLPNFGFWAAEQQVQWRTANKSSPNIGALIIHIYATGQTMVDAVNSERVQTQTFRPPWSELRLSLY